MPGQRTFRCPGAAPVFARQVPVPAMRVLGAADSAAAADRFGGRRMGRWSNLDYSQLRAGIDA